MSEAELQALCEEWQKRLGLRDWQITAECAPYHELSDGKAGNIEWNLERRGARIKILRPGDEAPGGMEVTPESVLVHELLHIHFRHYEPEGVENTCFEQALNAVSGALVALKRESWRTWDALDTAAPAKAEPVTDEALPFQRCVDCGCLTEQPYFCVDERRRCVLCYRAWRESKEGVNA